MREETTVVSRAAIYAKSFEVFFEQPVNGDTSFVEDLNQKLGFQHREIPHAHNTVLQIAASGGIVASSVFLGVLFVLAMRAVAQRNGLYLVLMGAFFTINTFDNLFFFAPLHVLFWLTSQAFRNTARGVPLKVSSRISG
jgi:hypothetical protein